jgi:hypothetical protein
LAESTLDLSLNQIQSKLGLQAGWGRGAVVASDPAWTSYQQAVLDDAVQSASRRFYHQPMTADMKTVHEWSFLKPVSTLDLPAGVTTISLPDDFAYAEGPLTIKVAGATSQPWRIDWRNEGYLRQLQQTQPNLQGPPMYAAVVPVKGTTQASSTRWQLLIFPMSDQDYTLQLAYAVSPDYLSLANPYPWGGAQYVEAFLECCYAVLEERLDDHQSTHAAAYEKALAAAIAVDRKAKAQHVAPNTDTSDNSFELNRRIHYGQPAITYNGSPVN